MRPELLADFRPVMARAAAARIGLAAALVAASLGLPPLPAAAGGSTALNVAATVQPYTRVEVVSAPRTVTIAQQDIDRGYVDVGTPLQLAVTSNDPLGAVLMLAPTSDFVERSEVSGLAGAGTLVLGRDGGFISLPYSGHGSQRTVHSLRFRLFLASTMQPGTHPWPIQLSSQLF